MINYGVVYPQAILMFVITLLYSVVQPLIVIFGAIYFGVGYVVYKYKLLFGTMLPSFFVAFAFDLSCISLLQTLRISGSSLAHYLRPSHLGYHHLPPLHDWYFYSAAILYPFLSPGSTPCLHSCVQLLYSQVLLTFKQICCSLLCFRSAKGGGDRGCCKVEGRSPRYMESEPLKQKEVCSKR